MMWPTLAALGVGLIWWKSAPGGRSMRSSGAGWSAPAGTVISPAVARFLDELAARLPFPLFVTSATRTPDAQARAWGTKIAQGWDLSKLLALYKRDDLVREVWDGGTDPVSMAATFARQVARGDFISSHMTGYAFDLRTSGGGDGAQGQLSPSQIKRVEAEVKAMGGRSVLEANPAHLHVEVPRG